MQAYKISTAAIGDGLDRKQLTVLKRRFLQVNRERIERTRSALATRQQVFLNLLPLLFHTNHPMLPGYVSHQTPTGVSGYTPSKEDTHLARTLARSFCYKHDRHKRRNIYALYLMGSVGTLAQSNASDLDVWVCYRPGLSSTQISDLDRKCQQLRLWAAELGLESHFFLMDCECFRRGEVAAFDSEASGSTQHYLLLDEFYRTALLLCGRSPLWWFSPAAREWDYLEYTHTLLHKRFMRSADVLDFGGVPQMPEGEFIGAGIWQLYKGIESPYKSVLKLMLLESYASEHPTTVPLSLSFKEKIYDGLLDVNELDPYVMLYRRLEAYLIRRNQPKRLELVRRCFYFKVNKPLTTALTNRQKSWQRSMLEKLVNGWGWDRNHLFSLDTRPYWKASQVMAERELLANELNHSYFFLTGFARRSGAHAAITINELNILGRKLHAAFEHRAGKIDWVNPGISKDLSEPVLTLARQQPTLSGHPVWVAYTQSSVDIPFRRDQSIKQSRDLIELLLWCYCNGVLTAQTLCEIVVGLNYLASAMRQQTIQAIQRWLPLPMPVAAHNNFQHPAKTLSLLLLINLETKPHPRLQQQDRHLISHHVGSLGYRGLRENLISTIDLISLNSWNEVSTRHFEENALLYCLLHYLRITPPQSNLPVPQLTIRCLDNNHSRSISQRVENLLLDIVACYYSDARPLCTRYLFTMGNDYYCLQFRDQQPYISHFYDIHSMLEHLGKWQANYSPLMVDRHTLQGHPISTIANLSNDTAIQIFYWPLTDAQADVYVLDEKGSLVFMRMPFPDRQTLLRPLHKFIRTVIERQNTATDFVQQGFGVYPVTFYELKVNTQGVSHCKRRRVSTDLEKLWFFKVQAIADNTSEGCLSYTLYCQQQVFSERQLGAEVFDAVAQHLLSQRHSTGLHPCYITDLDLSKCHSLLAPQGQLQTSHYLRIKMQLEVRLNAALRGVYAQQ